MVIINELRITPDGRSLIIDASIENLVYYKDVNIAAVIVDSQDTYRSSCPSNQAIFHHSYESEDSVVSTLDDCASVKSADSCECNGVVTAQKYGTKHIRLILTEKELGVSLNDNIFFVYIVTSGTPTINTPCGMDNLWTMGVVYNPRPIYNHGMGFIRELADNCSIPKNFIDYILRFKAFELALKTGNYTLAIEYWKKFFRNRVSSISKPKRCGCNGSY